MIDPLSITASIAGCVTFGAKISILLYDLASTFKESSYEIKSVAKDITIFCSVLKQLESAFTNHDKAARFSEAAVTTISGIVGRCQEFLQEIEKAVESSKGEPSVGIADRAKRLFRRKKVHLLNGSFQTMTVTLHLMITTLEIAHNICLQDDINKNNTQAQASQKEAELMAEGLVISHEFFLEELQVLESDSEEQSSGTATAADSQHANRNRHGRQQRQISEAARQRQIAMKSSTSAFLADAVACPSSARSNAVQSLSSIASQKSMLLKSKWTTAALVKEESLEPASTKASNDRDPTPLQGKGIVRKPERQTKETDSSQDGSDASIDVSNEWNNLNSRWENTISKWILKMEEQVTDRNNPMTSQLFTHIASLSAAGSELFKGYSEVQVSFGKAKAQFTKDLEIERGAHQRTQQALKGQRENRIDLEKELTTLKRRYGHTTAVLNAVIQELEEKRRIVKLELERALKDNVDLRDVLRGMETQLAAEKTQRMNVIRYLTGETKEDSPILQGNTSEKSDGLSMTLPLSPPSSPPPTRV